MDELPIEKAERKYAGYHRKFPDKIPTQGMLKSPIDPKPKPYMHIRRNDDGTWSDMYLHKEPDGTWTDEDSHLVEVILGSGK